MNETRRSVSESVQSQGVISAATPGAVLIEAFPTCVKSAAGKSPGLPRLTKGNLNDRLQDIAIRPAGLNRHCRAGDHLIVRSCRERTCTAGPPVCGNPDPGNPGKHGGDNPDPGASAIPTDAMIIGCRIWADPKPMPDDLKFRNIGGKTIPAGTRVYWLVKATGDHGYYYPPVDILPGKELPDLDVLKTVTETTNGCRSMIM